MNLYLICNNYFIIYIYIDMGVAPSQPNFFTPRTELNFAGDNSVVIPYYISGSGEKNYMMYQTSRGAGNRRNIWFSFYERDRTPRTIFGFVQSLFTKCKTSLFKQNVSIDSLILGFLTTNPNNYTRDTNIIDIPVDERMTYIRNMLYDISIYNIQIYPEYQDHTLFNIDDYIFLRLAQNNSVLEFTILDNKLAFVKGDRLQNDDMSYSETPRQCAVREFNEETSNTIEEDDLILVHIYISDMGSASFFYEYNIDDFDTVNTFISNYRENKTILDIFNFNMFRIDDVIEAYNKNKIIDAHMYYVKNFIIDRRDDTTPKRIGPPASKCALELTSNDSIGIFNHQPSRVERIKIYAGIYDCGDNINYDIQTKTPERIAEAKQAIRLFSARARGRGASASPPYDLGAWRRSPSGGSNQQKMLKYINKIKMLTN